MSSNATHSCASTHQLIAVSMHLNKKYDILYVIQWDYNKIKTSSKQKNIFLTDLEKISVDADFHSETIISSEIQRQYEKGKKQFN